MIPVKPAFLAASILCIAGINTTATNAMTLVGPPVLADKVKSGKLPPVAQRVERRASGPQLSWRCTTQTRYRSIT